MAETKTRQAAQAELDRRAKVFLLALATELRTRGHKVDDVCRDVDGISTCIRVQEQKPEVGFGHYRGNGRLCVYFRCDWDRGEHYTAQEGSKNGFNVKKAADAMEKQVEAKKRINVANNNIEVRRAEAKKAVIRVRKAAGVNEYQTPGVGVNQYGHLEVKLGDDVTEAEAIAVLKLIAEMHSKSRKRQ